MTENGNNNVQWSSVFDAGIRAIYCFVDLALVFGINDYDLGSSSNLSIFLENQSDPLSLDENDDRLVWNCSAFFVFFLVFSSSFFLFFIFRLFLFFVSFNFFLLFSIFKIRSFSFLGFHFCLLFLSFSYFFRHFIFFHSFESICSYF